MDTKPGKTPEAEAWPGPTTPPTTPTTTSSNWPGPTAPPDGDADAVADEPED